MQGLCDKGRDALEKKNMGTPSGPTELSTEAPAKTPAAVESPPAPRTSARPPARRCHLTVLFCDLSGSTQLGADLEAEHYADLLGQLRNASAEIVAHHGGLVVRAQGDGMLAIFGYPAAGEDDGRRATEAALDIHDHARQLRPAYLPAAHTPLAMHSGIHAGLLLVDEGDIVLGRLELLGNVPNIASRLSAFAKRNEIVVSEESLGPQAHFFVTDGSFPFHPRGSAAPLSVYRIKARAQTSNRFEARALWAKSPFVGRDAEMQQLQHHLAGALAGTPQCVAVSASPGMGKTRLIEEFLSLAAESGCQVHKGYCESYLGSEPLQPFLQMLRALFGLEHGMPPAEAAAAAHDLLVTIDPLLSVHADEFMHMLSLPPSRGAAHRSAAGSSAAALRDLMDLLSTKHPLLLFVDDWQWADDASRQVMGTLLDMPRPVFVLVASRGLVEDDLMLRRATTLSLPPLGLDAAVKAVARLLPGTNPFIAADIHARAGGNPLYIEELCHSAVAQGPEQSLQLGRSAAWLNALVESRVARLPAEQARIVRTAAVIGNVFPAWVLEQLTGHGENDPLVRGLAEQDFIFPTDQGGMLRFKHGLTRDVIYDAVGLHDRRALHLAAAAVFESERAQEGGGDSAEALAYHYGAGGDAEHAALYSERAGDKAMGASALDRTRVQYLAALAALDEVGKTRREAYRHWVVVLQKLGVVCVFDPLGVENAVGLFTRGLALAQEFGDTETVARAHYWLGYVGYGQGRARLALEHGERALALAEEVGNAALAAQVRATLGQVLSSAADYDRALPLLEEAVDAKRRMSKGGRRTLPVGSAYSLSCKGLILGDRGQFEQAHECFAQALDMIAGANHQVESSVRGWICTVYQWQGRWHEGLQEAAQAVRIGEMVKSSHLLAISRALWGYCLWIHEGDAHGLKAIAEATAWTEARRGRLFSSLNHGWLVDGLVTQGRLDEMRPHAARLLIRAREHDHIGEALGCRALARAAAAAGHPAQAARYLVWADRSAQRRQSPHEAASNQLCRAEVAVRLEQRDVAGAALQAACTAFEPLQMRWHLARAESLWRTLD
jgi:class 3 adenylate cyclase/tetratricopeptide (TPR) repeat protein